MIKKTPPKKQKTVKGFQPFRNGWCLECGCFSRKPTMHKLSWPTRARTGAGVACFYVECQKNIGSNKSKKGAFAHRCAAVAVRGAFRRGRLHHNVGDTTGVISALVGQLKRQEAELNGARPSWLDVDWSFGCFWSAPGVGGAVPCRSQAGTWTGSDWGAAGHHAGDQSCGSGRACCPASPCSGCRRRGPAACSSRPTTGEECTRTIQGGTKRQQKGKCGRMACKTYPTVERSCAKRQLHHKRLRFKHATPHTSKKKKQEEKIKPKPLCSNCL